MWIKPPIGEQRRILTSVFEPVMLDLSKHCAHIWSDVDQLDKMLCEQFYTVPHCQLLYALDKFGRQISSNISTDGINQRYRGQDLSRRPYSVSLYPKRHFMLSSVYISHPMGRPCISAVQPVIKEQQFLGFIVADFDINTLPFFSSQSTQLQNNISSLWKPQETHRITTTRVFKPKSSVFDHRLEEVTGILGKLIHERGIFHCMIHYSSAQILLWHMDNPFQYELWDAEHFLNEALQHYPLSHYTDKAVLAYTQVKKVLNHFRILRLANENIYLRSSSINIVNGLVGVSFSYEDSLYMPVEQFVSKDIRFWLGQAQLAVNAS